MRRAHGPERFHFNQEPLVGTRSAASRYFEGRARAISLAMGVIHRPKASTPDHANKIEARDIGPVIRGYCL